MYNIIRFTEVDSTNRHALREMDRLQDGDVIVAERQTAGRGRLDRSWFSPPEKNLYFSIVIKDFINKDKISFLTIIAALAVVKVLRDLKVEAELKWPNDILVANKKICGILSEANSGGVAVGIGLNVNMDDELLQQIDQPATSITQLKKQEIDKEKILNNILDEFFGLIDRIKKDGLAEIVDLWKDELKIVNRKVKVVNHHDEFEGLVKGIDNDGALLVENLQGIKKVLTGDVQYVS